MSAEVTGFDEVRRRLAAAGKAGAVGAARGLNDVADMILLKAIEYCPKDTNYLAYDSSGVTPARVESLDRIYGAVIYFNAGYALFVHENLEAHHNDGERAKFLATAIEEYLPQIPAYLCDAINEEVAKAVGQVGKGGQGSHGGQGGGAGGGA